MKHGDAWNSEAQAPSVEREESIGSLLILLPAAVLRRLIAATPLSVRHGMISFFGIVALVSPLFLWIAFSKLILLIVVSAALGSVAIVFILIWFGPEDYY